ncbi:MAG: YrbL family protein [Kluyvera sp.]|uniref:YrbL family protein n=1 Tax=Kluyvera sp. TaxID=1538228 RepID=UPI003A89CAA3
MIVLSDREPLGKGAHRACYENPANKEQCIKIVYNYNTGGAKEIVRELKYYKRLSKKMRDWSILPRYHGVVETDIGQGYVYDIIRDYDGRVSKPLSTFIQEGNDIKSISYALNELEQSIYQNQLITMTIKPQNILCQTHSCGKIKLVIVDNIGEAIFIPLARLSKKICIYKQKKKWRAFSKHIGHHNN